MNTQKNIAVVGTGYWGKNLVRNFHNLGALHTICDTDPATSHDLAAKCPNVAVATSYNEILVNPDISAVAIATPAHTHSSLVQQALISGKDVFVEKPLSLSEQDARKCVQLSQQHNALLMVGHLLWYHPAIIKLHQFIDEGLLGRIQYIYSNRLNLGKLRREENVLWSFAPHDISVILGLVNEEPLSIQAHGGNYLHSQIADTTVTLLEFGSGIKAHIFVSWLHPFKEQKLVVVGDRQMAVFDDTLPWSEKLKLYPHSIDWQHNVPVAHKAVATTVDLEEIEPLHAECSHFIDCLHSRKAPKTDGNEAIRVLKVLNKCQESLLSYTNVQSDTSVNIPPQKLGYYSHASAEIDSGVVIGNGSKIWHFSHLMEKCQIGVNCSIGQNVVVGPNVVIGDNCKVQNNVSIYSGVTLENNVFCGPSMVFTNVINPRCEFSRKDQFLPTVVKTGATLGANCCIVCGHTIGTYAFIAAGAVVTTDVPDFALMMGNPARQKGWMSRFGERIDFTTTDNNTWTCPQTKEQYTLINKRCQILS